MTAPNQVDQRVFTLRPNTSQWAPQEDGNGGFQLAYKPNSVIGNYLSRLNSADGGPYQFLKVLERVCDSLSLVGFGTKYSAAADLFKNGWTATIYPRLPGAFQDLKKVVGTMSATSEIPGFFRRKCISLVQETTGFVSSVGYAVLPFLFMSEKTSQVGSSVLRGAKVTTFVADVCGLEKSAEDAIQARSLALRAKQLNAPDDLINNLRETRNLQIINTMKSVCSVASFVLGLGLVAAGLATLPNYVVLASAISMAGTFFAVGAGLYKEGMKYKPVDFFDGKQVQYIAKTT